MKFDRVKKGLDKKNLGSQNFLDKKKPLELREAYVKINYFLLNLVATSRINKSLVTVNCPSICQDISVKVRINRSNGSSNKF